MWFRTASKRSLADLLERPGDSSNLFDGSEVLPDEPPPNGDFVLAWPRRPSSDEAPTVLIVQDSQRRDLLAWAATFKSSYRPFTAFLHVISHRTCSALLEGRRIKPNERGTAAAVGAIMGDALASSQQASDLTLSDCAGTYAYAMGRAYALGLSELYEEVTSAWQVFASVTSSGAEKRREITRQRRPWKALATAASGEALDYGYSLYANDDDTNSARVVAELYRTSALSESTLHVLGAKWSGINEILPMLRESREIRVQAFQRFAESLSTASVSSEADAEEMTLILAYVASRLAPGSLEYFRLLRPLEQHLPGLLVWYGICAAFQTKDFVGNAGALGRRLYRDLSAPDTFPASPSADISVWDLEVFARVENSPLSVLGNASLEVELLPGVTCTAPRRVAASSQGALLPEADRSRQFSESAERLSSSYEVRSLLDELRQALSRVQQVQYKLERMTGDSGATRAPSKGRRR